MPITEIERKIRDRAYQSPSRARAAVSRSRLGQKAQARLVTLIDVWENEAPVDHVVAGLPEAAPTEIVDPGDEHSGPTNGEPASNGRSVRHLPVTAPVLRININARVRVKLTIEGVALLHGARASGVQIPDDLLARQGVWETTLWQLMAALGPKFTLGGEPIEKSVIELLETGLP